MPSTEYEILREKIVRKLLKEDEKLNLNDEQIDKAIFRFNRLVAEGHAEDYSYVESIKRYLNHATP